MWQVPKYKTDIKKYGEIPAKLAAETLWNKLYVDLVEPYKIRRKGKEAIILKGHYKYRPRNRVVSSDGIQIQKSDGDCKLGRNYVAGAVYMDSRNHVWPRKNIPRSRV